MTNQQHPITPPPELVRQWIDANRTWLCGIALEAAQWGADQELEALMSWLRSKNFDHMANDLLAARRPKPPTLKKEALKRLEFLEKLAEACGHDPDNTIRLALEQLND